MLPTLLETLILSSSCFHNLKKTTTADTDNNRTKPNPTLPFCLLCCQLLSYAHFRSIHALVKGIS